MSDGGRTEPEICKQDRRLDEEDDGVVEDLDGQGCLRSIGLLCAVRSIRPVYRTLRIDIMSSKEIMVNGNPM